MDFFKSADYSTPESKRRFVESQRKKMLEAAKDINPDLQTYLEGAFGARRQKAVLSYLDRAETEFSSFGLQSVVEEFTENELYPFSNYNYLDSDCDLRIGAALWILDKLRASGKMYEAFKILPDVSGDVDVIYLPMDFHHPCYDTDLIQAVIYTMTHRYRTAKVITEENARGKAPDERYTALIELLPPREIKAACETFKSKLWDLITRRMKGRAYYDKSLEQITQQILKNGPMTNGMFPNAPFSGSHAQQFNPMQSRLGGAADNLEIARRGETLIDQMKTFTISFDKLLLMDRNQRRRATGSRVVADALEGFKIDDPFEICFALFYLTDNGDDAPWLIGSGGALMSCVIHMLPWYVDQTDWDEDEWDDWYDGMEYDRNGWLEREAPPEPYDYYHEKHGEKNLAQVIYGLCRGIVPIGLHPFEAERQQMIAEGMDEDKARKLTDIAEMLFLHSFQARQFERSDWIPEDYLDGEDEPDDIEPSDQYDDAKRTDAEELKPETGSPLKIGGYWGKVAVGQGKGVVETDKSAVEENKKLLDELEQLRKQLKNLKTALYTERHAADADRARYERELKSLRMEHRELADLRSLVFNQENAVCEVPTKGFEYPYETKKRTVIFGGHDSWLKVIKPMLPDVRFVDANNLAFNPEIIRNSDVVWIQNNCISHPQYWSIVKNCKQAQVQMRYFGFASAEKCAEQLVIEDQK